MSTSLLETLSKQWELVENSDDARKILTQLQSNDAPEEFGCKVLLVKCLILTGSFDSHFALQEKIDALFPEKSDAVMHSRHHLVALFHLIAERDFDKAREQIRKAMAFSETDVNDTLLSARILIGKGQRQLATTQLVNASKEASNNWATFYWLAENLFATRMAEKAKLCLERARHLNPGSELCASLQDKMLAEENAPDSSRLEILLQLLRHRPNSQWALKQATILEINAGQLDQAVDKCQRLIRLLTFAFGEKPELPEQRRKLCVMWTLLGEAYRQKGNLQSAVRACRAVLELEPTNYTAKLQLIQLHQGMSQYREAIALGEEVEREIAANGGDDGGGPSLPESLSAHFRTIHLFSIVQHLSNTEELRAGYFVRTQLELLPEVFRRAKQLLDEGPNSSSVLLHKCTAQALRIVQSFNEATFSEFVCATGLAKSAEEGGWGIRSRWDLAQLRIRFLVTILQANRQADSWSDLGLAFLETRFLVRRRTHSDADGDNLLDRATKCFKSAISATNSKQKRSEIYCNLGRVSLAQNNAVAAQHCFIRAIQLNKHCEIAWALLSLLYLRLGLNDEALTAMNNAQKISPSMSEAWCAHAILAEQTKHFDTMDLYRHTIVLKPSTLAVEKYCQFLMEFQRSRKSLDEGTMINFEVLKNLYHTCGRSVDFVHALSCLAEHFSYLEEARDYLCSPTASNSSDIWLRRNRERILIKMGLSRWDAEDLVQEFPGSGLKALKQLYAQQTDALLAHLRQLRPTGEMLAAIDQNDPAAFIQHYQPQHFPLIACVSLLFGMPIPRAIFSVVESVRPLHQLVEVMRSTAEGDVCENTLLVPQQEGEAFVRHDNLTERLGELLKSKVESQAEENNNSNIQ